MNIFLPILALPTYIYNNGCTEHSVQANNTLYVHIYTYTPLYVGCPIYVDHL